MSNTLSTLFNVLFFATEKHKNQRRKDKNATPYINHPIMVTNFIVNTGKIEDINVLAAALLHDTIEDTETTAEEITHHFGEKICSIVLEVTDDKSLDKQERKRLQIVKAKEKSIEAKRVKLGDKISNITDITNNPPGDWDNDRKIKYIQWSQAVIDEIRGTNNFLETYFDTKATEALRNLVPKHQ